jgi:glucosamine--fructose-6-phosphate aminotransferase (isomerizing)
MCGIVGYVGRSAATPVLLSGLRRLEYRGYDSAGLTVQDGKTLLTLRAVGKVARLADKVRAEWQETTQARCVAGIAHTRWATHGAPTEANAHPHADAAGRIRLVHNGIIENYRMLRTKLEAKGHVFSSETDTEAVARLIGEYYKGDLRKAVISALRQVEGAYGIAVISADEPGRIVVARKGSPLVIGVGEGECLIASDPSAIISHTRRVIYLDDGDVALVTADSVDITDLNHAPMDRDVAELEFEAGAVEKGGFEHFMLKEIHEQPESVRNALRGRLDLLNGTAVLSGMGATARELLELHRIVMVGCGTSLHAGMVGDFAFEDLAAIQAEVQPAAEFRYRNPLVDGRDLVVAISQSGETADTLAAVREAKEKGAMVMGLVNVVGSTIARETGRGVYLHAGPEISVASTKAFTSQVAVLLLMALKLGRGRRLSRERGLDLAAEIARLPELIEAVLKQDAAIAKVAEGMVKHEHAFYLGRGPMYPVALEGALKLKEISYIHAEGYHAAELKHGPIALLTPGMPVVVIANRSPVLDKTLGNAEECNARGAHIIAIVTEGGPEAKIADEVIRIPDCDPLVATVPAAVALQLLSYHVARLRGCPIDQPRNLAKSVTVE